MKTRKADGQILVIILLVLSILSIFILSMVTNARRDSQESRDNQKYEQFYSIGEQQLILAQQATGLNQLSASKLQTSLASVYNISDIQCIDLVPNVAAGETSTIQCSLPEASYETGSLDKVETNLYFSDDPVLQLFQLAPNSNFKIDLINGTTTYTGGIKLYWNLPNSQTVNWIITIDYFLQSGDNNVPSYKSIKVSDLTMSPGITIPSLPYTIGSIGFSHALEFNISTILSSVPGSPVLLGVRIKPLVADGSLMVPMGIVPDTNTPGTFPSQFRKIVAVVNSTSNVNTGTNKSPTPVLTLEYPISMPINPLLDYVYRGGEFIQR